MKDEILSHLNDPGQLEKLYRSDKALFKREFSQLYPDQKGNALADFWNERLHYDTGEIYRNTGKDLLFVIIASVLAGFLAKLPSFFSLDEEFYYARNIGFIVFPAIMAYFAWKGNLSLQKIVAIAGLTLAGVVFINALPADKNSDTLVLSCLHLLLFLWSVLSFAFVGSARKNYGKRLGFLRYNGDLVVITTLILIAGGIMTALTIALFGLIGFNIEDFYFRNVVPFALPAAPIAGTYLTRINPQLVGKISPVIARIFSPLVLVMLIIYLAAMVISGKDPFNDREFLLVFNALLIGVMAIIFFSVAESANTKNQLAVWVLFLLSAVTVVVNGIALSAILFRISEWGITPNRAAVLGGNVLILINLFLVTTQLFRVLTRKADIAQVGNAIALYLPVYFIWTILVTFVFPFLFGFK